MRTETTITTDISTETKFSDLELGEKAYCVLACLVWGKASSGLFYAVFSRLPVVSSVADYVYPFLIIVSAIFSLRYLTQRMRLSEYIFVLVAAFFYLIALLNPMRGASYVFLNENASLFYLTALPYLFVGATIDIDRVKRPFFYISIFNLLFQFWYFVNIGTNKWEFNDGSDDLMSFAYSLLPSVCYLIWFSFDTDIKKVITIPLAVIGSYFIFSLGNRGSFVMMLLCLLSIPILKMEKKKIGWFIAAVLLVGYCYLTYFEQIMSFMLTIIGATGGNTRMITFMSDNFFDGNGRKELNDTIWMALDNAPLFGYGLAGDRNLLNIYSHNLFIEFIMSFGWAIGILIGILLCVLIIKAVINSRNNERFFLMVILWGGVGQLMFSSTFLSSPWFFFLLGYCAKLNRNKQLNQV